MSNRQRRKLKIRKKIFGTKTRPRLCVFRSLKNIYAQIIDDVSGTTLVSAKSKSNQGKNNLEIAKAVGEEIAKKALAKKITTVHFDRAGYAYHGSVKALAEGAREAGLKF